MSRRRKGADKTLESYRQVLDSMVNFLGASGALLRQRIETGHAIPEGDCEDQCVICKGEEGTICPECSKGGPSGGVSATMVPKECAASKSGTVSSTDDFLSTTLKPADITAIEVKGDEEKPAEAAEIKSQEKVAEVSESKSATEAGTSTCVCSQVRKIKEAASKANESLNTSSSKKSCACRAKRAGSRSLCACAPNDNRKQELQNIIVERLNTVSKLVNLVQVDLSNLSGQSKSAALYQEIMKEGSPLTATPSKAARNEYSSPYAQSGGAPQNYDNTQLSALGGEENKTYQRTSTPPSSFTSDYPTGTRPAVGSTPGSQQLPMAQLANFVQCMFRQKRQKPGQPMYNFTDPGFVQDERSYRNPVASQRPAYQSARAASLGGSMPPTICGRNYGSFQRMTGGRNLASSQQYSLPQGQYGTRAGNLGSLQRTRPNYAGATNLPSPVLSNDGTNYEQLQGARNMYRPIVDVDAVSKSPPAQQTDESEVDYLNQSFIACTEEDCTNDQCGT